MITINKSPTIDELKKEYEYELEPLDLVDSPITVHYIFYKHFNSELEKYYFEEKMKGNKQNY